MKILWFEDVHKSYGDRPVLVGLDLEVEAGERLVLLGPSGSGKTTLLRLIAGFTAPDRGEIRLRQQPVSRAGKILVPPEKRGVGMVFQDLALWPHMSVEKNVEFGLWRLPRDQRKQRVREVLEMVGLADRAKARPHQLSGGQQQRVALARALAPRPDILLMDEPLSSLDPGLRARLRDEIVGLQEAWGFTLIYVTHDQQDAARIATRTLELGTP